MISLENKDNILCTTRRKNGGHKFRRINKTLSVHDIIIYATNFTVFLR